jgi:hypothetical protein
MTFRWCRSGPVCRLGRGGAASLAGNFDHDTFDALADVAAYLSRL